MNIFKLQINYKLIRTKNSIIDVENFQINDRHHLLNDVISKNVILPLRKKVFLSIQKITGLLAGDQYTGTSNTKDNAKPDATLDPFPLWFTLPFAAFVERTRFREQESDFLPR